LRLFVDTSTLFKKYVDEPGSPDFDSLLNEATDVVVSPLTHIEMHAALSKCIRENLLPIEHAEKLRMEIKRDFAFYSRVYWNENLEEKAVEVVQKLSLKTLDAIQLASGILSKADIFVTSDRKLFEEAHKVIQKTKFI